MVEPNILCRQHLLGEHNELHMFVGVLKRDFSVTGYLENNLLEVCSISDRHSELVSEMLKRGYNHNSPLETPIKYLKIGEEIKIDRMQARETLISRCKLCKKRLEES